MVKEYKEALEKRDDELVQSIDKQISYLTESDEEQQEIMKDYGPSPIRNKQPKTKLESTSLCGLASQISRLRHDDLTS